MWRTDDCGGPTTGGPPRQPAPDRPTQRTLKAPADHERRPAPSTALFTETLALVTGTNHATTDRPGPLPALELATRQLALLSGDFATRGHIDAYLRQHRVSPRIAVEANSIQALTEVVQRTPLATVLPDAITDGHPRLTPIPLDPAFPTRTVILLHRIDAHRSAATRAFTHLAHGLVRTRGYTPAS